MNCEDCKHFKVYTTGMDEYPQCTPIAYCRKGHWENSTGDGEFYISECADYEAKDQDRYYGEESPSDIINW